jgi:hypothetical protein
VSFSVDSISLERLSHVYPDVKVRWIRVANDMFNLHGRLLRVAQGLRTYADQQAIYEKGRVYIDGKWMPENLTDVNPVLKAPWPHQGIVTWSKPGDSWHHFSAVDSCFIGQDPWLDQDKDCEKMWAEYARLGRAHGFSAGYDWPKPKQDRPHLQMTYGLKLAQVKDLYAHGGLRAVWAKFDQIRGVEQGSEWKLP